MEFAAFGATLALFATFPGLIFGLILVAIGYVLRKYVEKRWPNEALLLDTVATRYGKEAEAAILKFRDQAKDRYNRL